MSHYRPLPKNEDCEPFAFDPPLRHDEPPRQVARLIDELTSRAIPAAVPHDGGAGEGRDAGPADGPAQVEDEADTLRQSMLAEIEAALATEDSEIACFHVTLANVYARRLIALGSVAAEPPSA